MTAMITGDFFCSRLHYPSCSSMRDKGRRAQLSWSNTYRQRCHNSDTTKPLWLLLGILSENRENGHERKRGDRE